MNRRTFLTAAAGAASASAATSAAPAGRPMNVLFVVSDDLSPTALGCYGHPVVQSPNVDSIARSGTRFERAYCQYALCAPSRASFLTGLRPNTTRVLTNGPDFREFNPNAVTMPQLFKNNGYQVIREGKMFHMGVPTTVGTDRWQDAASWNHNGSPQGKEHNSRGESRNLTPKHADGRAMNTVRTPDPSEQADFDAANKAIAHIEKHRDTPFFLGLGFVRPHVPLVAPGKYFDMYPLARVKPFVSPAHDNDDIPEIVPRTLGDTAGNMGMDGDKQREALRAYYACISFMDDQLGRVLQTLDRLKLRDNTVVVFQSDHGWHLGEHGFWQKRSLMEESARVPLIVSAPGRKGRGRSTRAIAELVDVYPTVANLCGLTPPRNLEGKPLTHVLDNPAGEHKATAHTQLDVGSTHGRAVRTENFRYIRWSSEGGVAEELYDHRRDPHEFTNLAAKPGFEKDLTRHRSLVGA